MLKKLSIMICLAMAAAPGMAAQGAFKIRGYLGTGSEARHVLVEAGRKSGVSSGEVFRAVRPAGRGVATPVETGLIKVIAVHEDESIAEVIHQGTPESQAVYGPFSEVMAGDLAMAQRIAIAKSKVLTPEVALTYGSLFDDPKSHPETFELTLGGKTKLRDAAERFAAFKVGMLIVEGHTDQKGSSDQNQIESYQRALTVRQYLIDELGFDEARVTAIGLGESEPMSDVILPGNSERARRIVLKVVAMPGGK